MTAIQAAQHQEFCKAIDSITISYGHNILMSDKDQIENLYSVYRNKICEIQNLITDYKKMQIQIRKKMACCQRQQRPLKKYVPV